MDPGRTGRWLDADVADYVARLTTQPDDVHRRLHAETNERLGRLAGMSVAADQGAVLSLFVGITQAMNVVEVGTFTGSSSLWMARALPPGGRLLCCDISVEWTDIARRYWSEAGVDDRITLRIGPALDTLRNLPDVATDPVDLAFVDADKGGYAAYYEELLVRMRTNGVILVDNTLWSGKVLSRPERGDDDTAALIAFNEMVAADDRVESYLLPVADGLTVIRAR